MNESIIFGEIPSNTAFLKGVIFGDSGSGKSHLAKDFAIESCKNSGINRFILIDTENGWEWLKKEIPNDIKIIEPNNVKYLTDENTPYDKLNDFCKLIIAIKNEIEKNPVSCIVIDSCSHIGQLLYYNSLSEVNSIKKSTADRFNKAFYPQIELAFQDWKFFNERSDIVVNILRKLKCHIMLCGRATSDNAISTTEADLKSGIKATTKITASLERTVLDWKKITYELDFSCLLKPTIDLTNDDNFKSFKTYVLKSRFSDDGKVLNNNNFIQKWFSMFEKMDFEKVKTLLVEAENLESFESAKNEANKFRNQMNDTQKNEVANIVKNKKIYFDSAK